MTVNEVWPNGMPSVGQTAQRSREISGRDIELFTEISGDRNPLHYDEEVAKATRFGGIVVQGGVEWPGVDQPLNPASRGSLGHVVRPDHVDRKSPGQMRTDHRQIDDRIHKSLFSFS